MNEIISTVLIFVSVVVLVFGGAYIFVEVFEWLCCKYEDEDKK